MDVEEKRKKMMININKLLTELKKIEEEKRLQKLQKLQEMNLNVSNIVNISNNLSKYIQNKKKNIEEEEKKNK